MGNSVYSERGVDVLADEVFIEAEYVIGFCGMRRQRRFFFFQAEDGIRDVERSRGLGDVYKSKNLDPSQQFCHEIFT